jgi:hypothetical protein
VVRPIHSQSCRITAFLALLVAALTPLNAQALDRAKDKDNVGVRRTPDGKPDLNGIWMMKGFNARYYIQPGQLPPFQPGGEARFNAKHAANDDPGGKCLPFGMPRQIFAPNAMQIIQTPGQVAILYEFEHMFRVISTLGEPHSKNPESTWNGESVGKWEGDTLVIDTVGLNPDTWMDRAGHMHSEALHLIERYRRLDSSTLEGQITVDDPKIFTRPWTVTRTYEIQSAKLAEYVCEEQNQ